MISRSVLKQIETSVKCRPVTLITGARGVGKAALAKMFLDKGFSYVSLDFSREREMARKDPSYFLLLHPWPLIIDEIQRAPELFSALEEAVNKQKLVDPHNYGMYIITGSQIYRLMQGVTESMAGRISIIHMLPLTRNELLEREEAPLDFDLPHIQKRANEHPLSAESLFQEIVRGHYPELYENALLTPQRFYADYVESYIERDVTEMIGVRDKFAFRGFMEALASCTGQELVFDKLAKAVGIDLKTAKAWISVLLAGDIIHLLQPYSEHSILKRVVHRPKVYFTDTGLACYLGKINSPETLRASFLSGAFVETYVVNAIRASYLNNGEDPGLYYYRDSNQNEIDLIVVRDGALHRVEIKSGITYDGKSVKGFRQVEGTSLKLGTSLLFCLTDAIYPIKDGVYAAPIAGI